MGKTSSCILYLYNSDNVNNSTFIDKILHLSVKLINIRTLNKRKSCLEESLGTQLGSRAQNLMHSPLTDASFGNLCMTPARLGQPEEEHEGISLNDI
jgi:hypothetical protein